jgi:hypothetical protein
MQKEKSIALRAVEKRGGLCFAGASTDHSCQREAVVPQPWPGEKEIVMCEEHALAHGLAHNAEDLFNALEALHALIHAPHGLTDADTSAASIVFEGLYRLRDDLERRYFDVLVKERGADLVASGAPTGPGGAREFPRTSRPPRRSRALTWWWTPSTTPAPWWRMRRRRSSAGPQSATR